MDPGVMARLGLTVNETKTSIKDARRETFDFLGYSFGPHRRWDDGRRYLGASPSKKSIAAPARPGAGRNGAGAA